ncbi:50S ribosomal protein L24 [Candidatus Micrarchaeota archaeon]|nr:50S ribosomal protein L24 [Candidatus Micrarchaeota archaeon]
MTSKQPRKQRKKLYSLKQHERRVKFSAGLDKKLKAEYKKNSFPLVKGDKVKVFTGKFSGKEGKVTLINGSKLKIGVEGITVKKPNGKEEPILIDPSNVIITELKLTDEKRKKALLRK